MTNFIYSKINHLQKAAKTYNIKKVVGIGGTITTASSINQHMVMIQIKFITACLE